MSQKKSPVDEPINERGSKSDAQINEPTNERSSQSGTKTGPRIGKNPKPADILQQNKCGICGQTFSNQTELREHNKKIHGI